MTAYGPVSMVTTSEPAMARVLRMTAMRVASSAELHIDRVEDLALAVSEAFALSTNGVSSGSAVKCEVEGEPGSVRVRMAATASGNGSVESSNANPLSERVLTTITDELTRDPDTGEIRFRVSNA